MATSWKGMDWPQRIATLALSFLAVIALVAVLTGCGSSAGAAHSSAALTSANTASSGVSSASPSAHGTAPAKGQSHSARRADGLDTIRLSQLPSQAQHTVELIDSGGPYPYNRDGVVFGNYEAHLPKKPRGWYHEYTVPTPGASTRGARRIIAGQDGTLFYTADHYQTFKEVLR